MSGVRHRGAPVMPLGVWVCVPHLRHHVGGFRSAADQLLMLITHAGQLCPISAVKKKGGNGWGGLRGKAPCHLQIHKLAQVYQAASLRSLSRIAMGH